MKKPICKCGLRKNGTWWYMVDGKFANEATFTIALYAPDSEEADIATMDAVITPATVCKPTAVGKPTWNYDISPALLLVVCLVVLVFVMVLLGLGV